MTPIDLSKITRDTWMRENFPEWGIPERRILCMKPGDSHSIKDLEIVAVESFDRTALLAPPPTGDLRGKQPPNMDERAVNYVIKTPGGNIYHSGDSHFSNRYLKHGRDHQIDISFVSFGEDGPGITDKVGASDALRIAWSLNLNHVGSHTSFPPPIGFCKRSVVSYQSSAPERAAHRTRAERSLRHLKLSADC